MFIYIVEVIEVENKYNYIQYLLLNKINIFLYSLLCEIFMKFCSVIIVYIAYAK